MTSYTLPDLPYDYSALAPQISADLLQLHHDKHHAAYVKGANETLEKLAAIPGFKGNQTNEQFSSQLARIGGAIIAQTYEGTFDFPELNGTRTMGQVLTGHRAVGRYRPEHWRVAFDGDEPVAVLLLCELEPLGPWELSYLGVLPAHRRHGWGRRLVAEALRQVADGCGELLEVAVDHRNLPALQLYAALGFQWSEERSVSLIFFGDSEIPLISFANTRATSTESP